MTIIRNQKLTYQQLKDLSRLSLICKAVDGNHIALYKHMLGNKRPFSTNLLYYQKKKLIGFLSTFYFYEDACEVPLMIAPAFRKKGIAKALLQEILPIIPQGVIESLIFSSPKDLNNDWLLAHNFRYKSSEYQMQLHQKKPMVLTNTVLDIRRATDDDLSIIADLDCAAFQIPLGDKSSRIYSLLKDPKYTIFLAFKEGVPVGKAHVHLQKDIARLTDIAIFPNFQGQGFGSELIRFCINYCVDNNHSRIILDVETTNQLALKLYDRLGFTISNAYDFWIIPITDVQNLLN